MTSVLVVDVPFIEAYIHQNKLQLAPDGEDRSDFGIYEGERKQVHLLVFQGNYSETKAALLHQKVAVEDEQFKELVISFKKEEVRVNAAFVYMVRKKTLHACLLESRASAESATSLYVCVGGRLAPP